MEEQAAAKLVGIENRPATTRNWRELILSIEGELDSGSAVTLDDSVVDACGDAQKRELAKVVLA